MYKRKTPILFAPQAESARIVELPNGLHIIHKYVPFAQTVHCGFIIDAGSRDDLPEESGMAHFIEHMVFKGTRRRKTFHVLNYLESVGGEMNAYTTKEKTCVYAALAAPFAERAVELLSDIVFESVFPEKEIPKERQVIADEIDMYRDMPDEAIVEDFDLMIFPDHALGRPILGTKDSLNHISQAAILQFIQRHYTRGKVAFSMVGNISEREMDRLAAKYLSSQVLGEPVAHRTAPPAAMRMEQETQISTTQAHEILGGRAYALNHERHYAFQLLNNLLGGPAMNSRLNLNIRERFGLTYSINTFYTPYIDSGLWGVYYSCDDANLQRIRRLVLRELRELREKPLGQISLQQVKNQLAGQIILGNESLSNQMLGMAKDVLDFGEIIPFTEHLRAIETVTAADIQACCEELFDEKQLSRITYLPDESRDDD